MFGYKSSTFFQKSGLSQGKRFFSSKSKQTPNNPHLLKLEDYSILMQLKKNWSIMDPSRVRAGKIIFLSSLATLALYRANFHKANSFWQFYYRNN